MTCSTSIRSRWSWTYDLQASRGGDGNYCSWPAKYNFVFKIVFYIGTLQIVHCSSLNNPLWAGCSLQEPAWSPVIKNSEFTWLHNVSWWLFPLLPLCLDISLMLVLFPFYLCLPSVVQPWVRLWHWYTTNRQITHDTHNTQTHSGLFLKKKKLSVLFYHMLSSYSVNLFEMKSFIPKCLYRLIKRCSTVLKVLSGIYYVFKCSVSQEKHVKYCMNSGRQYSIYLQKSD